MLGIARSVLALLWKEMLYRARYPISLLNLAVSPFLIVGPYVMVAKMYGASEEFQVSVAVGLILWYWLSELFWIVGFAFRDEMEEVSSAFWRWFRPAWGACLPPSSWMLCA